MAAIEKFAVNNKRMADNIFIRILIRMLIFVEFLNLIVFWTVSYVKHIHDQ